MKTEPDLPGMLSKIVEEYPRGTMRSIIYRDIEDVNGTKGSVVEIHAISKDTRTFDGEMLNDRPGDVAKLLTSKNDESPLHISGEVEGIRRDIYAFCYDPDTIAKYWEMIENGPCSGRYWGPINKIVAFDQLNPVS